MMQHLDRMVNADGEFKDRGTHHLKPRNLIKKNKEAAAEAAVCQLVSRTWQPVIDPVDTEPVPAIRPIGQDT